MVFFIWVWLSVYDADGWRWELVHSGVGCQDEQSLLRSGCRMLRWAIPTLGVSDAEMSNSFPRDVGCWDEQFLHSRCRMLWCWRSVLTVTGLAEDVKEFATGQTWGGLGFSLDFLLPGRCTISPVEEKGLTKIPILILSCIFTSKIISQVKKLDLSRKMAAA